MKFPTGTTQHPINKSGKRKILVSVWDFGAVHPQSERNHYVCNAHPAKMRPSLARAILQVYGESPVLDPMTGVGTTLVEAMILGMNAVGVEFEKKFVNQANKNIKHVQKLFHSEKLGKAVCIQGDARNLSCLNKQKVNSVVFSPPYFNAIKRGDEGPHATDKRISYKERVSRFQGYSGNKSNIGNAQNYGNGFFGSIVFSPPYCGVMDAKRHVGGIAARDASLAKTALYSTDESNLGNIRNYGESRFGSIVFSPPYADVIRGNKEGPMATSIASGWKGKKVKIDEGYSRDLGNIGNIAQFGSIIFSPPYWIALHDHPRDPNSYGARFPKEKNLPRPYSMNEGNIGNIPQFGSVIFSPPFGEANKGSGIAKNGYDGKYGKDKKLKDRCDRLLSQDKNNISNIRFGCTYLGEMFKVYSECYRVLKSGKFMVVVVKDIRRKGLTIPLGADTIKLCQMVGFELFDIIVNKMYFPSFWKLTQATKVQAKGIPMTLRTHEHVLVFRKPKSPQKYLKCF